MKKRLKLVFISLCVVALSCPGKLYARVKESLKESLKVSPKDPMQSQIKISKYNFASLRKKLHIENQEQVKGKSGAETNEPRKENEGKDEKEFTHVQTKTGEEKLTIEKEYEKCINMIENEFKDKKVKGDLKIKEELEMLCLKKREEDEVEEKKLEREKLKKEMELKTNGNVKLQSDWRVQEEHRKKEIISNLGLSNNLDISLEILSESLSEVKNCMRNYSEACPLNWKISENNKNVCNAPDSYIGPCGRQMSNDIDVSEKIEKEKTCSIFWPCDYACTQDFENSVCPLGWVMGKSGDYCISPDGYTGSCLKKIKFINMSSKEKSIYSNLCDIRWPCKQKCTHDYSVLCPDGWVEGSDGYCFATSNYKGNCEKKIYLKHLDDVMKQMYEHKCQFNYPCINSCEKNYDDICPKLWIPINDKECAPTEYYNGNCKDNYIFVGKNMEEEKKEFEKFCHVSYACLKKCDRDYSFNCPIGWGETISFCLAPSSYQYNCDRMMKKNMNQWEKIQISKKCLVFWPCSNYEILLKNLLHNNISPSDYLSVVNGPVDDATGAVIHPS
ncbi:CPW-WPC family protein [Plasmodium gonderi]|uniref:CPW-WPC family protein n=1 Tax=Plasmodium gonderi TaxID=77519 RepID=A0A1Y1JIJ4_PLAGO|nr:CPW-WPC family protein [Plasmodium gonderi]GAW80622.1 CPW-WPC family protein [Plasmodium gonderi]